MIDFKNHSLRLAIMFTDPTAVPMRFKKHRKSKHKIKIDTIVERRFQEITEEWEFTLSNMNLFLETHLFERLIYLKANIENDFKSISDNADFIAFTDYFIKRRNIDLCPDYELGCLSRLHTSLQKQLENFLLDK